MKHKRHARKILLLALLAVAASTIALGWRDTRSPVMRTVQVELPSIERTYRILQVADLHGAVFGDEQARLVRLTKGRHYDAIVMTGDMVLERGDSREPARQLAIQLRDQADAIVFVRGNHDDPQVGADLHGSGVTDTTGRLTQLGNGIVICDLSTVRTALQAEAGGPIVIAEHAPPNRSALKALARDGLSAIVLSGHMHGGQIRLPLAGAVIAPPSPATGGEFMFFPELKGVPTQGTYREGDVVQHISAGLGAKGGLGLGDRYRMRLGSRAELTEIILTPAKSF